MKIFIESSFVVFFLIATFFFVSKKNNHKERDKSTILKMCGCYEVTFNYAETFVFSSNSEYIPSLNKSEKIYEWIDLVEKTDNKIVLQHILQTTPDTNAFVIKHWRQDWQFEDEYIFKFYRDKTWIFENLSINDTKGKWTQKVYQIDDMPRYSGVGTWVHVDGKVYWENTTDAPLARRESMIRSDYNILNRGNRIEITKYGWLHEQDNKKILRSNNSDTVIAMEKGYNTYKKTDDENCSLAIEWWKKNSKRWKYVRDAWNKQFIKANDLVIDMENNTIDLYNKIMSLESDSVNSLVVDKIIGDLVSTNK